MAPSTCAAAREDHRVTGTERLVAEASYEWIPFALDGHHLTFNEHRRARLEHGRCSAWGAAVYKWEGPVQSGPQAGKSGVLIGETGDLRQRIKQYVSGTQERGNRLWRETFLQLGEVRLYTLRLHSFGVEVGPRLDVPFELLLASANLRLLLEQLLVMAEVARADGGRWVVNARK